jgi:DNA invertase Pin-like site-specific DNA recombinase
MLKMLRGASAELKRLLAEAGEGDILLVESIDRLSRLPQPEWEALKRQMSQAGLNVVALDLPLTYLVLKKAEDGIEAWLQTAMARMLADFMAAFSRKDYEMRRQRQAQGIEKARQAGRLKPRQPNFRRYKRILELRKICCIRETAKLVNCSKGTVERAEAWARSHERAVIESQAD